MECGGESVEDADYSPSSGLLLSRSLCNGERAQHRYEDDSRLPTEILLTAGRRYSYVYDTHGGLREIRLPNNGRHTFLVHSSSGGGGASGGLQVVHTLPGGATYATTADREGRRLVIRGPGGVRGAVYRYSPDGHLSEIVAGDRLTQFHYSPRGELTEVRHQREINLTVSYSFNNSTLSGLLEERLVFDGRSALVGAKFSHAANISHGGAIWLTRGGRIGGQSLPRVGFNPFSSLPLERGNFFPAGRITDEEEANMNVTSITDGHAIFQTSQTSTSLVVNKREVFRAEYKFNTCAKIRENQMLLRRPTGYFKQVKRYTYDGAGQLAEVQENSLVWRYSYDPNGNLVKLVFGKNEHSFTYNEADQLVSYNNQVARATYDSHGRMVRTTKQFQLRYSPNSLLMEANRMSGAGPRRQILYYYDHLDRLIGRHDDEGRTMQFFYALPGRPHHVSHIYSAWEDTLTSLVYNNRDQVVFARIGRKDYYIISDWTGAPFLFFASPSGDLVKEVNRSPYGQITYDSDPSVSLPLGLWGGIEDVEVGLLHVQGAGGSRPYDPLAGLYLTPVWESVPAVAFTPELLHVYRRNGNDPVNAVSARYMTGEPTIYHHRQLLGNFVFLCWGLVRGCFLQKNDHLTFLTS